MRGLRGGALLVMVAVAGVPAASAGPSAGTANIVVPPSSPGAKIIQAPAGLSGSVDVTVSGMLTNVPTRGVLPGRKYCYDLFHYQTLPAGETDCSSADWKGHGTSVHLGAGSAGCRSPACMTVYPFVSSRIPTLSDDHTYRLKLKPNARSFWAYPFTRPVDGGTWAGGFKLEFSEGGAPAKSAEVTLVSLSGDVSIRRGGGSFRDASRDDVLREGDDIATGPDSTVTLMFSDGTTCRVRPFTQISIGSLLRQKDNIKVQVNLKMGAIAAEVNRSETAVPDYSVKTPVETASVRGTTFSVFYDPSSRVSVVSTTKGVVSVDPAKPGLPTVMVRAGKEVEVSAATISPPAPVGKAGARGGVNRVVARDLVLKKVSRSLERCGLATPRSGAPFSVSENAGGWNVAIRVTGALRGWAVWAVTGRRVNPANALAKKIATGCPGLIRVRTGHYVGKTSRGQAVSFDVTSDGKGVARFRGQSNVSCGGGATGNWTVGWISPVPIRTLSFSGTYSGPLPAGGGATNIRTSYVANGKLDTSGGASGSFRIKTISWDQGGNHLDCTGVASTWTAKLRG